MAWTTTDKYWGEKLKIVQQENETLKQQLLERFKEDYEQEEEGGRATLKISSGKPGQSPGDDRTKEPYDKDWPPPAPLAPKLANAGDLLIQGLPRGGYYGNSHRPARQSGELTNDKLIETLKIAGPLLRGA